MLWSLPTLLLAAQVAALPAERQTARDDSARVLAEARRALERFERVRLQHLPWGTRDGAQRCDEILGRWCITHDDSDDRWRPPPEPARVRAERDSLLAVLAAAARRFPGDEWVAGHRVHYLLEAGHAADALVAAVRECGAPDWWCRALAGSAHHAAGDFVAAGAAFDEALAGMPAEEARRWRDVTVLLPDADARAYRRLPAAARDSLDARLWWLADPMYLVPGNEARTEHLSRRVLDRSRRLEPRAPTPTGRWDDATAELLIRYGEPVGWERLRSPSYDLSASSVSSHNRPYGRSFIPPLRFLADPWAIRPNDWPLDVPIPTAEYAPSYAAVVDTLAHQVAVFRDGDAARLVAWYALPSDSVAATDSVVAALIVARDERAPAVVARQVTRGPAGVVQATVPPAASLVSLEVMAPGARRAARARFGMRLDRSAAGGAGVSDLLLLTPGDSAPASLDDAVRRLRRSDVVTSGERLTLYWEVYDLDPGGPPIPMTLAVEPPPPGRFGRAAARVGLRDRAPPVLLSWDERPPRDSTLRRTLTLQLPALPPGRYAVRLTLRPPGGAPREVVRALRVRRMSR